MSSTYPDVGLRILDGQGQRLLSLVALRHSLLREPVRLVHQELDLGLQLLYHPLRHTLERLERGKAWWGGKTEKKIGRKLRYSQCTRRSPHRK